MSIFRRVVAGIEVDGIREIRFVRLGPILAQNWSRSRVRPPNVADFFSSILRTSRNQSLIKNFQFVSMSIRCIVHCKIAQVNTQ
jgi:hypothetical protein